MAKRRIRRADMLSASSEIGPEDGIDPRYLPRGTGDSSPSSATRKQLQLCREVARLLEGLLADSADPVLRDLQVLSVVPAQATTRLLVTVAPTGSSEAADPAVILQHLDGARPRLRTEVAAGIVRRKAPDLTFQLRLEPGNG